MNGLIEDDTPDGRRRALQLFYEKIENADVTFVKRFLIAAKRLNFSFERDEQELFEILDSQPPSQRHLTIRKMIVRSVYQNIIDPISIGIFPKKISSEMGANIALYIAIDQAHVTFVAELVFGMEKNNWRVSQFSPFDVKQLIDCIEIPTLNLKSGYNSFDRNDIFDPDTLDGRIGIIKSFLNVQSVPDVAVDESTIQSCFDFIQYDYTNEAEMISFLDGVNTDGGFLFVELGNPQVVSCVTRESLMDSLYSLNTKVFHCLQKDPEGEEEKSMNFLGNQPIIKIQNSASGWYIYRKSLENIFNFYKSAVIYLRPCWNLIWRASFRNWYRNTGQDDFIADFSANQHCQFNYPEKICALEVCKGTCVKSERYKYNTQQSFSELYFKDQRAEIAEAAEEIRAQRDIEAYSEPLSQSLEERIAQLTMTRDRVASTGDAELLSTINDQLDRAQQTLSS